MKVAIGCGVVASVVLASAVLAADRVPPVAPGGAPDGLAARPIEETYFGTRVMDRFRFIESKDPATLEWMKAQGGYVRAVFDSIVPRATYLKKLQALGAGFGLVNSVQIGGARIFYLERKPGSDVFDLLVREPDGSKRTLVDVTALTRQAGGGPRAIDYFQPSRDGARVAIGISAGGSEASDLTVVDVNSGQTVAGPIDRAQWASPSWLDDGSGLFFGRLQELGPGATPADKYLNSASWFWNLKDPVVKIVGASTGLGPVTDPVKFPFTVVIRGANQALLLARNGVQNELEAWTAPLSGVPSGHAQWRPLATAADAVTAFQANATTIYALTHKDAPTFKVLSLPLTGRLSDARTVVPARPDRVVGSIHLALDGLYVVVREGLSGKLLHVNTAGVITDLKLPFNGSVAEVATEPTEPGAIVGLVGWVHPKAHFRYDPHTRAFTDLALDSGPKVAAARYAVAEVSAQASDGTKVPLSVITPVGPRQPRPMLLDAYGSYGASILPYFTPQITAFVDAGGAYAECHVRGGGELGEAWRLGGKDENKPNSWRDFIACAEMLIANSYTTRELLTIQGTSAGGITVGRAATERPDLFAGAVARVGDVDPLRSEVMPSGPANIPEFGTFKDAQGFKNLLAMDAYQHLRDDGNYPAFLLTTGLNDPRVEPWEPAKMAARLMDLAHHPPVLLRVEDSAGHGLGTTKSTRDAEDADIAAFVFWRAGLAEWQPRK